MRQGAIKKTVLDAGMAYNGILEDPIPPVIQDVIISGKKKSRLKKALAAALVVAGLAIGFTAAKLTAAPAIEVAQNAESILVQAHKVHAADKVYPVQVDSSDMLHLNDWLSYRVGRSIQLKPQLARKYELLGARLVAHENRANIMAIYKTASNERISMLIMPMDSALPESVSSVSKLDANSIIKWQGGLYRFAATGAVENATLTAFQNLFAEVEQVL